MVTIHFCLPKEKPLEKLKRVNRLDKNLYLHIHGGQFVKN